MFNKTQTIKGSFLSKFKKNNKDDISSSNKNTELNEEDKIFYNQYSIIIDEFKKSDNESLSMKPMNSYYRHLIHQLAQDKGLYSISEGFKENRHLVIHRKPVSEINKSKKPSKNNSEKRNTKNFRDSNRFNDNKNSNRSTNNYSEKRTSRNFNESNRYSPRDFNRNKNKNRSGFKSEKHTTHYLAAVPDGGLEIIVDKQGFVGIRTNQKDNDIVDSKKITSGLFTVNNNKIEELV